MVYDISKYKLSDVLEDERLISGIMMSENGMTTKEAKEKIKFAYDKCKSHKPKSKPVKSNDHQPCQECGGINFQRTGTCFVCLDCYTSQGCS